MLITKEQIEQEGFKQMESPIMIIENGFSKIPYIKNNIRIDYNYDTNKLLVSKFPIVDWKLEVLYKGGCSSINEFRKIMKLLNIQ